MVYLHYGLLELERKQATQLIIMIGAKGKHGLSPSSMKGIYSNYKGNKDEIPSKNPFLEQKSNLDNTICVIPTLGATHSEPHSQAIIEIDKRIKEATSSRRFFFKK